MIRLTTPKHTFTFPASLDSYEKLLITYQQNRHIILEKTEEDLIPDGENRAHYVLTQEETKMFSSLGDVQLQVRALTTEGKALASTKFRICVDDVLNEVIL